MASQPTRNSERFRRISEGDAQWTASVPGVFGLAHLSTTVSKVKGGKGGLFSLMGYSASFGA
jgi:hypothetical protein